MAIGTSDGEYFKDDLEYISNRAEQHLQVAQYDTKLTQDEETVFKQWKSEYAPNDSGQDYDLRGAFKSGLMPDPQNGHWPDTYKKPNHPTFSNESIYAKDRPDLAGRWEGETFIPPSTMPLGATEKPTGELNQEQATQTPVNGEKPVIKPSALPSDDAYWRTPEAKERGVWNSVTGKDGGPRFMFWPEKAMRDFLGAAETLGKVGTGEVSSDDPKAVEASMQVAAGLGVGGLSTAAKREGAGIFGGALGALRVKNGLQLRDEAMKMLAEGKPEKEVFQKTGWFKDAADGRYKFEINDNDAQLLFKPAEGRVITSKEGFTVASKDPLVKEVDTLENVFHHPLLYKVYPEAKNIKVLHDPNLKASGAMYSKEGILVLGNEAFSNRSEAIRTILHEVQHWVQGKEGFAPGTNPGQFKYMDPDLDKVMSKHLNDMIKLLEKAKKTGLTEEESKRSKDLMEIANKYRDLKAHEDAIAFHNYQLAPGEIEARNVELRYAIDGMLSGIMKNPHSPTETKKMLLDKVKPLPE